MVYRETLFLSILSVHSPRNGSIRVGEEKNIKGRSGVAG